MPTVIYPALVEYDGDAKSYGIIFPDLPGCVSVGDDMDELFNNAVEAITLYLDDCESLPKPTRLEDIVVPEDFEEIARTLIQAQIPGPAVRINVTIEERLLTRIDRTAKERGMTRSSFLAMAAEEQIRD